jgi:hypothetical protein
MMPKDPVILLSYVNTKLRDQYSSLEDLCASEGADPGEIINKLKEVGYTYKREENKFI